MGPVTDATACDRLPQQSTAKSPVSNDPIFKVGGRVLDDDPPEDPPQEAIRDGPLRTVPAHSELANPDVEPVAGVSPQTTIVHAMNDTSGADMPSVEHIDTSMKGWITIQGWWKRYSRPLYLQNRSDYQITPLVAT
jgi:hypothetical protein